MSALSLEPQLRTNEKRVVFLNMGEHGLQDKECL